MPAHQPFTGNLPAESICGNATIIVRRYVSDINIQKDRDISISVPIVFTCNGSLLRRPVLCHLARYRIA
jgi:hypothetical protein